MRLPFTTLIAAAFAGTASAGIDDFTNQVTPVFRGAPGAEYAGWDAFTQAAFLPNFADLGGCAAASILQLDPAAIVTSTGNIYSFGTVTSFELGSSHDADVLEVSVQIRTLATLPDASSFALTVFDGLGNPGNSVAPDQLVQLDTLGNEFQMVWNTSLAGLGVREFQVAFEASASSMSTDVVLLDVLTDTAGLSGDSSGISTTSGASLGLQLAAGSDLAGNLYLVLGSLAGNAPGVPLDGVVLPLVPDAYTTLSLSSAGSGLFQNTLGNLDTCGKAAATLAFPAGLPAALAGSEVHHAYLVIDSVGGSFGVAFASNAVSNPFTP